jgi:hypothetical protein
MSGLDTSQAVTDDMSLHAAEHHHQRRTREEQEASAAKVASTSESSPEPTSPAGAESPKD